MRNVLSGLLVVFALLMWRTGAPTASAAASTMIPTLQAGPSTSLIIPVAGVRASELRSSFDEGRAGHLHHAIDIMAPRGTPVLAAVDGTVRKLYVSGAGGLTIYEFDQAGERSYYYAHLDSYAAGMREGLTVHRGDVIGYVGMSGNATTPHLHFGIGVLPPAKEWWKGEAIDPYPLLRAQGAAGGSQE
jgi:murein DD-endopeptidase MepM/ murein hydrolase activator NlpD